MVVSHSNYFYVEKMPQKRNKKYNPNRHIAKQYLPESTVQDCLSVIRSRLMRLRLSQKRTEDLIVVAVYWAIGVYLSDRMVETEKLKTTFNTLLKSFQEEFYRPGPMSGAVYDQCLDVLPTLEAFLRVTTVGDMRAAQAFVGKDGGVPEMVTFLDIVDGKQPAPAV